MKSATKKAGLITCTTISTGDRLGAQLGAVAALLSFARANRHQVVFCREFLDRGYGIRFLESFDFSPEIQIVGRDGLGARLLRRASRMFFVNREVSILGSVDLPNLLRRCFFKIESVYKAYAQKRVSSEYEFCVYKISSKLPFDIPVLSPEQNYDFIGALGLAVPSWVNEIAFVKQSISFKEDVLSKAKDAYRQYLKKLACGRVVGIHFRRGDYLAVASLNLGLDYYREALALFPASEWSLLIFSDDIEYCKSLSLFQGYAFQFSESNGDVVDLALMTLCDGLVTANSSFSFWGGMLGHRADRRVVCPKQFFGESDLIHSQLNGAWFPRQWIAIDLRLLPRDSPSISFPSGDES